MKFLIDAQLPPALTLWLDALGHDTEHVTHIGMGAASDVIIAQYAEEQSATIITKDEDFL